MAFHSLSICDLSSSRGQAPGAASDDLSVLKHPRQPHRLRFPQRLLCCGVSRNRAWSAKVWVAAAAPAISQLALTMVSTHRDMVDNVQRGVELLQTRNLLPYLIRPLLPTIVGLFVGLSEKACQDCRRHNLP